jgi:leucine dehydrogenase
MLRLTLLEFPRKKEGGAGIPSRVTAYGVYMRVKVASKHKLRCDVLTGKKVLVQGIGHVEEILVDYLTKEVAIVIIADSNEDRGY